MDYGFLTLLVPILTLAVAIATRKVPLAMLLGIFVGQLIVSGWNPFTAINAGVNGILDVCADTGNLKTFLFTALMGAFVILVRVSGGVKGFVNYLTEQSQRVKSKRMAMLIAYVIGIIIFIDGLLSIMFTGVVTRPLIDKFKVSREKLAYICDATSAPVNAIIPLNSGGAMLMGLISAEIASGYIQGEPMNLLIRSLPFQFYSILSLLFVLFYIITGKDWGPMKKAELRVRNTGKLYDDGVTPLLNDNDGFEELVEEGKENKWKRWRMRIIARFRVFSEHLEISLFLGFRNHPLLGQLYKPTILSLNQHSFKWCNRVNLEGIQMRALMIILQDSFNTPTLSSRMVSLMMP
mgnify:CR=1 FL=1